VFRRVGEAILLVVLLASSAFAVMCYHGGMSPTRIRRTRAGIGMFLVAPKRRRRVVAAALLVCGLLAVVAMGSGPAVAQNSGSGEPPQTQQERGMFERIGNWFDRQFSSMKTDLNNASESINRDTRRTMDAAKDAMDAVTQIPDQRAVRGREVCAPAANGAPDCQSAADRLCRGKGYSKGQSVDSTTAENCPAEVLISGRTPTPGECKTETFISRALCAP
jgi:hypothetical protein